MNSRRVSVAHEHCIGDDDGGGVECLVSPSTDLSSKMFRSLEKERQDLARLQRGSLVRQDDAG